MTINTTTENSIATITIHGEIDASNSVTIDSELKAVFEGLEKNILLDCENLTYISSAGLGVIMSYIEDIKEQGINFVIYGLSDQVFEVFQILGLDVLLKIVANKKTALEII